MPASRWRRLPEVEEIAKIDFFSYIPDKIEIVVESQMNLKKWGIR